MAVTFVLGRAGAGKTRHCVDALLSELDNPTDDHRLILLVPEQASFQMERTLATRAARRGYCRAEVLSFSRLAARVLAAGGEQPVVMNGHARAMALRRVAACPVQDLRYLHAAAQTSGFYAQLDRVVEELLREGVTPDELTGAAQAIPEAATQRKIIEIANLYREYLAWLGPERLDPAARLTALRERLTGLPWLRDASIWVDGFAGFTGQEQATLVMLARSAGDVTVTLLLDPAWHAAQSSTTPDPLRLFQRTELTFQRLVEMLAAAGVERRPPITLHPSALPRFEHAPTLARLEAGLATPIGVPIETPAAEPVALGGDVQVLECVTHRDELRQAARFIRRKVLDSQGQLRFRDFAVIARDLEPFGRIIAEVFAEYGLPYFLDRRRPMRAHPLSRLVEALFEAVTADFSVAAMMRLLRTGLTPLTREQAEELENVAVKHSVAGAEAWRRERWEFNRSSPRVDDDADALDAARLKLVAAIEPLLCLARSDRATAGAEWARTLHAVLGALGVRRQIEAWSAASRRRQSWERAETHRLAWEALCSVLEDLHDVLGDTRLRVAEAAAIIGSAVREQTLGLAPPTLDQVLVASIERSRHPDIKYAWVFAFNEGVFPARPAEDKLLSTAERTALADSGLAAPASHRDDAFGERLLAYIACTRPHRGLTISYATVGADGDPLLPSPLLDEVRAALPGIDVRRPEEHAPPACLPELARSYLRTCAVRGVQPGRHRRCERLCELVRQTRTYAEQLDWLLRGVGYRNAAEAVDLFRASGEPGLIWSGSPSEIETFLDCPFKHLAKYGLRLDAARGPQPLRWDLGSCAHEILADVTRRAMREPGGVRALPDERWQVLLRAAITDFNSHLPADLAQRRPDLTFHSELLYEFLGEVVAVHAERWRRGRFEPAGCELAFDRRQRGADLPPLELEAADGQRMRLRGKIDRLDRCRDAGQTRLIVYDYKSSTAPVGGTFLTGARLQLFSYLLAVQQAYGGESDTRVAGVFLAPLYPDTKVLGTKYVQAAAECEQRMYMYRPQGLFARDAARLLDEQLRSGHSPVVRVRLKKDGDFDRRQSANAVTQEEIEQRLELARRTLRQAAEGIAAGRVDAAPLVEDRTLACGRCEYQSVCRFDRALNQPRLAEAVLPTIAQVAGEQTGGQA